MYELTEQTKQKLKNTCDLDLLVPLLEKLVKLNEEVGEANAATLAFFNSKNVSASAKSTNPRGHLVEELVDVYIMLHDIMNKLVVDSNELDYLVNLKVDKWLKKHNDFNRETNST